MFLFFPSHYGLIYYRNRIAGLSNFNFYLHYKGFVLFCLQNDSPREKNGVIHVQKYNPVSLNSLIAVLQAQMNKMAAVTMIQM